MSDIQTVPQMPADGEDLALKARHRAMWALGDYPAVASEVVGSLGPVLVDALGIGPGDRVVDVAAGSGNAAIAAALTGATVVATDLTPELMEVGQRRAAELGLTLKWREADAEAMPCTDGQHDVVMSCIGVMFAPHHQRAANELARICRSNGRIGIAAWTPSGFIGQMFAAMKPFTPPPPPDASPPPLWGDPDYVAGLFGKRVRDISANVHGLRVDNFATPADFREYFKTHYGPTIATYRSLGDDAARVAELDAALDDLAARSTNAGAMTWDYLVLTARRS